MLANFTALEIISSVAAFLVTCITTYTLGRWRKKADIDQQLEQLQSVLKIHELTKRTEEKVKIDVISDQLDKVVRQQEKLTEATKQIESNIEHQVWKKQELQQLKRKALEEYYECIDRLPYYLIKKYSYTAGRAEEEPRDLYNRACVLQDLYLPELYKQHVRLLEPMYQYFDVCMQVSAHLSEGNVIDSAKNKEFLGKISAVRSLILPILSDIRNETVRNVQSILGNE
ncbi:hypothetical protein [Shewanella algae]|uniref:hypothetical protein n=1 Tax=Shewanella algae TaxID=38313 RepID=UPI00313E8493